MNKWMPLATCLYITAFNSAAGTISNGQWQPANCGQKTPSPQINTKSVDDFNNSIKDINTWQAKAQEYYNCLVTEANSDNEIIAKSANTAQEEFRNEVKRIQKEADAGKAKVEKK
ncbi:MAG: hypothetical protein HOP36_11445 [Methyloglobulus sp.]|nr:hypothetical protein [Methyloglobulus sp.]